MASGLSPIGPAATDLGLGAGLQQQTADETEEQRRQRMQQIKQQQAMGPSGSLAVTSLFGPMGVPGAGY